MSKNSNYIGRFAPSPSGPLHLGSLVAAVASYLQARSNKGQWLVRIEDLDPPREAPGATSSILKTLEKFGLHWDQEICYQSQRLPLYQHYLSLLEKQNLTYKCLCSRAQIKAMGGRYNGHCRHRNHLTKNGYSIRLKANHQNDDFIDGRYGLIVSNNQGWDKDFILKRKDGFFAYQLAVVVDDYKQKISEVVRGSDLIQATFGQIELQQRLHFPTPQYVHLPLVLDPNGVKLSKQNHANPIESSHPQKTLLDCLKFLGQNPDDSMLALTPDEIIQWAIKHWSVKNISIPTNSPQNRAYP